MFTSLFWKDTAERTIATVAQVLLGILTAAGFNLVNFDFIAVLTIVGVSAVSVVLKSLLASQVGKTVSPASLAKDERGI